MLRRLVQLARVVLLGSAALLPLHAHAAVPVASLDTNVTLNADGSAVVLENVELLLASAPFQRTIQTQFPDFLGNRRLLVDVVEVQNDRGKDVTFYTVSSPRSVAIRVPRPGSRGLKIIYGIRNAVQFGSNDDNFVFIANDGTSTVETASIHVTLPDDAREQFRAQSLLRSQNALNSRLALWSYNGSVPLQIQGSDVRTLAPGPLAPGVVMVTEISLNKGVLRPPGVFARTEWFLLANPIVFLPVGALLVMFLLRRFKPSTADVRRSVTTLYEPPRGLSPAEVGVLVDDRLDPRDICATLIDLAVRGYVRLEETERQQGSGVDSPDYIVRLLKPREEWTGLASHERTMLFHTFYGGEWTKLSSLRLRFPDIVQYFKADLMRTLKQKGMYRVDPETAQAWRIAALCAVAVLLGFAQVLGIVSLADSFVLSSVSLGISAFLVYWLGRGITAKTMRGMNAWVAVSGFSEFLRAVDRDRLHTLQADLFERYLPYAMALGMEHYWTTAFEGIAVQKPQWLDAMGEEMFNTARFGHRLDFMFRQAIALAPRGRGQFPVDAYLSAIGSAKTASRS